MVIDKLTSNKKKFSTELITNRLQIEKFLILIVTTVIDGNGKARMRKRI